MFKEFWLWVCKFNFYNQIYCLAFIWCRLLSYFLLTAFAFYPIFTFYVIYLFWTILFTKFSFSSTINNFFIFCIFIHHYYFLKSFLLVYFNCFNTLNIITAVLNFGFYCYCHNFYLFYLFMFFLSFLMFLFPNSSSSYLCSLISVFITSLFLLLTLIFILFFFVVVLGLQL